MERVHFSFSEGTVNVKVKFKSGDVREFSQYNMTVLTLRGKPGTERAEPGTAVGVSELPSPGVPASDSLTLDVKGETQTGSEPKTNRFKIRAKKEEAEADALEKERLFRLRTAREESEAEQRALEHKAAEEAAAEGIERRRLEAAVEHAATKDRQAQEARERRQQQEDSDEAVVLNYSGAAVGSADWHGMCWSTRRRGDIPEQPEGGGAAWRTYDADALNDKGEVDYNDTPMSWKSWRSDIVEYFAGYDDLHDGVYHLEADVRLYPSRYLVAGDLTMTVPKAFYAMKFDAWIDLPITLRVNKVVNVAHEVIKAYFPLTHSAVKLVTKYMITKDIESVREPGEDHDRGALWYDNPTAAVMAASFIHARLNWNMRNNPRITLPATVVAGLKRERNADSLVAKWISGQRNEDLREWTMDQIKIGIKQLVRGLATESTEKAKVGVPDKPGIWKRSSTQPRYGTQSTRPRRKGVTRRAPS